MTTFETPSHGVCTDAVGTQLVRGQVYRLTVSRRDGFLRAAMVDVDDLGGFYLSRFRPATPTEIDAAFPPELPFAAPSAGNDPVPERAALPDGNPKTRFGVAKPSVTLIPGPALIHCALAFRDGATKYGPANWRVDPVTASTYTDAAFRHLLDYWDGEDRASDSKVLHLAHAMACLAILIDAQEQGTLKDDRPTKGMTPRVIEENTRPIT